MRESLAVALAGMVLASAALKLLRGGGVRALLLTAIGRRRAATALMVALIAAELAVALGLVWSADVGLLAAAALFASFALFFGIFRTRLQGAECGCFGPVMTSRVGPGLIARALVLAAIAALGRGLLPSGGPSVAWVALAGALVGLVIAVGRDDAGAPPSAPGHAVALPGAPQGRVVLVFLHPDCPVCVSRASGVGALAGDLAGAELRVVVMRSAGEADRERLARRVGPAARLDHDDLTSDLGIRATPVAVAVEHGRVLEWRPGPTDDDIRALAGTGAPAGEEPKLPALTRRRLLGQGALGAASLVVLAATARRAAPAAAARAAARRRPDPNRVVGSCRQLARFVKKGVVMPGGRRVRGAAGVTLVSAPTPLPKILRQVKDETTSYVCPCLPNAKPYATLTQCKAECPSGLGCFAQQCQEVVTGCCVTIFYDVTADEPGLQVITRITSWVPPGTSSTACKELASSFNAAVAEHEKTHQDDARLVFDLDGRDDMRNRSARGCGRTCPEAETDAKKNLLADLAKLKNALIAEYDGSADTFHESVEGGNIHFTGLPGLRRESPEDLAGRFVVDCEVCTRR